MTPQAPAPTRPRLRARPPLRARAYSAAAALALTALCGATLLALALAPSAAATAACEGCAPWWHLTSGARPSYLPPGGTGQIVVTLANVGDAPIDGASDPVKISDELPEGLKKLPTPPESQAGYEDRFGPLSCSAGSSKVPPSCTFEGTLPPYHQIEIRINVKVQEGAHSGELNRLRVSGGGAASASLARPITLSPTPTPFGMQGYEMLPEEAGGALDTQAGSHPFQLTTTVQLNQGVGFLNPITNQAEAQPPALAKDLTFKLPAGLIGNPTVFPQCTLAAFAKEACPPQTALGAAMTTIDEPRAVGVQTLTSPVYNLEPQNGEPARFGFLPTHETPVFLDASVRTGEDYGVTVSTTNIVQVAGFLASEVTFWGVPGDSRHDQQRGDECLLLAQEGGECAPQQAHNPPPFLAMPTSCASPFTTSASGDSWQAPADVAELASYTLPAAIDGCGRLPFAPQVKVTPDGSAASTSTGINVDVHVPQDSVLSAKGLAESSVKDISVTLPEGVVLNPAGGNELLSCSEGEIGYLPPPQSAPPEELHLTPGLPQPFCPNASKVGTVKITTPLLPNPLQGAVYLATQNENPFGSLIAMYLVAEDPVSGTLVKLPGEVSLDQSTGQITGIFRDNPQLPFEDAELHFFGGERAPLSTPRRCGPYTTNASFTPWSGEEAVAASSTFAISSGPNGGACPGASLPFGPSLTGGTTNNNAGSFSPLSTTIGREDGNQDMQSVTLHMPAGLEGLLAGVKLCDEADANAGACPSESQIGETTVSAGVGSDPVSVKGGRVYITEKYDGAPFGLSIVNPVKAGPFDLEHDSSNPAQNPACDCVVVRAKIEVDPTSADLTVTTDPTGPHAIPHLIDGIPVQIKKVNVLVNRPGFTFNPTNCSSLTLTGSIASDEGASSPVSVPFQATNCGVLKFTPKIAVSTAAKTSKAAGANLAFKISYPPGAMGSQSWFKLARFQFPKQLPARLTTIQKACLAATFQANPAACPPGATIGHAVVKTPVLPVTLSGPVYFVSYGNTKFPDAVIVLQGYGITVELHGETFIEGKTGITTATFASTPDVPFDSIEVTIPSGPNSEFAANLPASAKGSFCGQKLTMPTKLIAQNGLEVNQNTPISVSGCPKVKKPTRAQKLAAALKACKKKAKGRRAACAREAHRRYGAGKKAG